MLEDMYWESTYSSIAHEEYMASLDNFIEPLSASKYENLFSSLHRIKELKDSVITQPFFKDVNVCEYQQNSLGLFSEDFSNSTTLIPLLNFEMFSTEAVLDSVEDSYEFVKNIANFHNSNQLHTTLTNINFIKNLPAVQVMDAFRPDFEEKSTSSDAPGTSTSEELDAVSFSENVDARLSNPFKLRASSKNAIVTYNAIQKVFKSRFDEGRSNARLQDFSNSYSSHPFVTAPKSGYESLISKNKVNFFSVNNYKHDVMTNFSEMYLL
jgi:hypothetical protein